MDIECNVKIGFGDKDGNRLPCTVTGPHEYHFHASRSVQDGKHDDDAEDPR